MILNSLKLYASATFYGRKSGNHLFPSKIHVTSITLPAKRNLSLMESKMLVSMFLSERTKTQRNF